MAGILTFDQGVTLYLIFMAFKKKFPTKVTKKERNKSNLSETHKKMKRVLKYSVTKKFTTKMAKKNEKIFEIFLKKSSVNKC